MNVWRTYYIETHGYNLEVKEKKKCVNNGLEPW